MVKIVCNRCGKECAESYYTVNVIPHNMHSDPIETACCTADYAYTYLPRDVKRERTYYSPIERLNRESHYCADCVCEIDEFLKSKE